MLDGSSRGKTASINLVDGLPRMGEGVGGASFSYSMEAVLGEAASIVFLDGLPLGMGLIGAGVSIDFWDGLSLGMGLIGAGGFAQWRQLLGRLRPLIFWVGCLQ